MDTRTTVEIFGQRYELRSTGSGERLHELAKFVDQRMRQLAEVSPRVDVAKLAVLTALNIADELFTELETEPGMRTERVRQRVSSLVAKLDEVLATSCPGAS